MAELTIKKIDELLENKNIDPILKASLENKKKILSNNETVKKG